MENGNVKVEVRNKKETRSKVLNRFVSAAPLLTQNVLRYPYKPNLLKVTLKIYFGGPLQILKSPKDSRAPRLSITD